jgi:hypothetical protein
MILIDIGIKVKGSLARNGGGPVIAPLPTCHHANEDG